MSAVKDRAEKRRKRIEAQKSHKEPWTLDEALRFIRHVSPLLEGLGWGIGLTGSVLTSGESTKDLDIIVFPHDSSSYIANEVRMAFKNSGMVKLWHQHEIALFWHQAKSDDMKYVEVWGYNNRRIDVFFMR